jgi:hypothetical protein
MKRSTEVHLGEIAQRVGTLHYNQDVDVLPTAKAGGFLGHFRH